LVIVSCILVITEFMENTKKKIKLLSDYFAKQPDIALAFIFGSRAKGRATAESDFDIAVYFWPKTRELEWEGTADYANEDKIWLATEKIAGARVDLVVLNRAPATVAFAAIQEGEPLVVKDYALYLRFFLAISSAAEYFRDFTRDFWAIKQRSASLNEIDRERLIRTVDFLAAELADYPKFAGLTKKIYETDAAARRNLERWAENIVNASIDAAKIIMASEKKRIPQTYREILQELSLLKNFNPATAERLAQFAKLRNILAHEYLDIRFNQLKKFVAEAEPLYRELADFIKKFLA